MSAITIDEIRDAASRLQHVVHWTQLDYSTTISGMTGCKVYLKQENLQRTGSFKIRGAYNKMASLTEAEKARGVIAASAGNHAQGVALAAQLAGIPATIVMPQGAPIAKVTATQGYGAKVIQSGQSYDEAYQKAIEIQQDSGMSYVHAFDDAGTVTGQGTVGLEIMEDLPEVEAIVVPIGGGGLISGLAVAAKAVNPRVKIFGVQAKGAPAAYQGFHRMQVTDESFRGSIADGIAVKRPGQLNMDVINQLVEDIVLVDDEEIAQAILLLLERAKVVAEGSGAVGVAALMQKKLPVKGMKTAVVVSGGNIDVQMLSIIIERGLAKSGRRVRLHSILTDRPGNLQKFLATIADTQANVISVHQDRIRPNVPLAQAEVEVLLETKDEGHIKELVETLKKVGYPVKVL